MKLLQTKIVATLGPRSWNREMIKSFIKNHVRVFRMNFSHVDYDQFAANIEAIRECSKELNIEVAILADLQGPKIRIGEIGGGKIKINQGETIRITNEPVVGTPELISISYETLAEDVGIGNRILIDDGSLELKVVGIEGKNVDCKARNGGIIFPRKGVNLPNIGLNSPALTEKDISDLDYICKNDFDFIALSFVRSAEDILQLKRIIVEKGSDIPIIAKIEKPEAVENIPSIIEASYGLMLARGDLGVEVEPNRVPIIQKDIVKKCNIAGKPIIVATQMLTSMVTNPLPTRAEANDVANAVYDGTDAVMLSNETAMGKYPLESVMMMAKIIESVEGEFHKKRWKNKASKINITNELSTKTELICRSAIRVACDIDAKMIVGVTHSGKTAMQLAKYRPGIPIYAVTIEMKTTRRLSLSWGVQCWLIDSLSKTDETFSVICKMIDKLEGIDEGDTIIFTAGIPTLMQSTTNMLNIYTHAKKFENPF